MADEQNKTPSSAPAAASSAAAPATQNKPRSGLTGHILPTFWQRPAAPDEKTALHIPAVLEEPAAPEHPAPVERVSAGLARWWYRALHRRPDPLSLLLLLCALLSLGIYLYGTLRFPLATSLKPQYQDIGQLTRLPGGMYDPVAGEWLLVAITLLFGTWGLACWAAGRAEERARAGWWRPHALLRLPLFGLPVVALVVLLFMYPITAVDVIDYAAQIRVLTIHHANPLTIPAGTFSSDPFVPYDPYYFIPASYGPLWAALSALVSLPAGDHILRAVLLQKLLSIAACLGCMVLIWLLSKRLCPERRWQAFVFFAWNPLVLFEVGANGHNDSIMAFFLLAGLYALLAQRWYWQALALPLLVASVFVKWTTILLLPLAIVYLLRGGRLRRWGLPALGLGTALTAAYALPLVLPFLDTRHTLGVFLQSRAFTGSPLALLHTLLVPIYGDQPSSANGAGLATSITQAIGVGVLALVALVILVRLAFPGPKARLDPWKHLTRPQRLIAACVDASFWYFVLATIAFHPWYLLALLPLAALDPRPLARMRCAMFAFGAPLGYLVYIFLWIIYWWHLPVFTVDLVACLSVFGLALFTRALEGLQTRQHLYALLSRAQFPPPPPDAPEPRRRRSWWLT
jgi:hypothetical protein